MGVFGSLEFKTNATKGLAEWQRVQKQMSGDERLYADCDAGLATCPSYLRNWRRNLKSWSSVNETQQLELINSWVNRTIRYAEDANAFGARDFWASPAASLKGRGDCEDYAIAKYASLKALGFGEDRMRIVIVNDTRKKIGHAVLSVKTMDGIYILDNQNIQPVLHQRISYYAPVYSINASGRWINIATRQVKPSTLVAAAEDVGVTVAPAADRAPVQAVATRVITPKPKPEIISSLEPQPRTQFASVAPTKVDRDTLTAVTRAKAGVQLSSGTGVVESRIPDRVPRAASLVGNDEIIKKPSEFGRQNAGTATAARLHLNMLTPVSQLLRPSFAELEVGMETRAN